MEVDQQGTEGQDGEVLADIKDNVIENNIHQLNEQQNNEHESAQSSKKNQQVKSKRDKIL